MEVIELYSDKNWVLISKCMKDKFSPSQCNQHYYRVIHSNIKKAEWSKEEDELLLDMIEYYGYKWSIISRELVGRSDVQCRRIL